MKVKLASELILQAAATSFSWASVSVFICASLLHRTFSALKCVNKRLSNGPFKQKVHCTSLDKKEDDSSVMKVCVSVDLCHIWTLY